MGDVAAGIAAAFTGLLMTHGCTGYQHLLTRLAGIEQCCQHVIRRCRVVMKLGPGGLQSWAGDNIAILREAHQAVEDARARGSTALGADLLGKLRERYDDAAAFGITHNRLRDWHEGNHPGYALGCWLRGYKEQVFLFTRDFAVPWQTEVLPLNDIRVVVPREWRWPEIEPAASTLARRDRSLAVTPAGRLPRSRFGLPLWCSRYGGVKNQACARGSQGRQELNPVWPVLETRWLIPR